LNAVPKATLEDFDGTLLAYGSVGGKRFGLPWASSTLIQLYNADAFKQKGLSAPRTWDDFVKAAKALTTRNSRGAIFFIDAWIYASMVSSRGGDILDGGTRPALDSSGSLQTLQMMNELVKGNQAIVRNFSEANLAVIDWVRTKAFIVTLPTSAFPVIKDTLSFKVGAVPMPGRTLAGESQLVMPKGKSAAETQGAFAFWSYLTRPENTARFSKATYYLPLRKSSVKQLGDFVNDPVMKAGLEALQKAYNPPQLNAYNDWRLILEAQLERSLKGGVDPKAALTEAQRQAALVR
jgi:sn-glycerol 3-phosphate transport system substrate-binding protein